VRSESLVLYTLRFYVFQNPKTCLLTRFCLVAFVFIEHCRRQVACTLMRSDEVGDRPGDDGCENDSTVATHETYKRSSSTQRQHQWTTDRLRSSADHYNGHRYRLVHARLQPVRRPHYL